MSNNLSSCCNLSHSSSPSLLATHTSSRTSHLPSLQQNVVLTLLHPPSSLVQGVLGIKVKIQLPHDPSGQEGVATKLPDVVTFIDPKDDDRFAKITAPYAQNFEAPPQSQQQMQQQQQPAQPPQQQPQGVTPGGDQQLPGQ